MEKHLFRTSSGIEIELNEKDMHAVHQHYIEQATADFLRDNHADWPEEKVQVIAIEARRQMYKYNFTEEEAIEEALNAYKEEHLEEKNISEVSPSISALSEEEQAFIDGVEFALDYQSEITDAEYKRYNELIEKRKLFEQMEQSEFSQAIHRRHRGR